jgi:maltose alpha-D-glucosyltransferase/alpha-amylase
MAKATIVDRPESRARERLSTGFPPDPQWYRDAIIYELHVRAFSDGDGDGIGDFEGLTERLDYLAELGITAVWLLPFYPSPLRDDGYDIADYLAVHPDYGTLADVRRFIREAHRRDLRVITELVFNHTSDQHPWFQRARRAPPGSVDRDWYVWSDTPERYQDARIIFKDFEPSNWSWDPVAGAYFWHRFYSHQPDLNFDQPRVAAALLRIVDFWLEAGVDGLRLDAIPYLYERDGTNGENLPETHAFLKRLRAHVDERFADRMFLAEANQWPEDAVAYFGDGDECHMAFHFPLMPRMFMALRMEDRYPIIDILDQTPAVPDTVQWALFLRNHDELTLEMVTDEERDYMYRVYAADPQARINLGIRRRLAPLLGNNRRRIELLNGLLFSLPGTPVIYYGDEIGMGDNVYLGDRNGVRTPMQWSADRNAGFSRAHRQRLYLPVITDAEYHYEAVNVDAQQSNSQSLLWWMRRVIALRKRHPAFGRGSLRFLHPGNRRILAYLREHEDETLLIVANLSRYAQWTELPLAGFEGRVPVELFGSVEFPRIGTEPYLINLGPHSFLWFRLARDPVARDLTRLDGELPELAWRGDLLSLAKRPGDALASILVRWIARQRWYRGGGEEVGSARIVAVVALPTDPATVVVTVEIVYRHAEAVTYVVPLATVASAPTATDGAQASEVAASPAAPPGAIARLLGGQAAQHLVDGSVVPAVFEALLAIVVGRRRVSGALGEIVGHRRDGLPLRAGSRRTPRATPMGGRLAMSNSSASFDERLVLKLYRVLEEGANPDLEVGTFLDRRGFAHVPRVLGSVEVARGRGASATLAVVQSYVAHESNLWETMRASVERFLHDVEASSETPAVGEHARASFLELSRTEVPEQAQRLIGPPLATAHLLGRRLGEMHTVLASADASDRAFAPEPLSPFQVRSLYQSIRGRVRHALDLLESRQAALSPQDRAAAAAVLAAAPRVDALLARLRHLHCDGQRIRVHGDLHLGHVLDTGDDVVFIDFEGDTARPLSERRLRWPALADLASLVRSFHFAAHWPRVERELLGGDAAQAESLAAWSTFWFRWLSAACIAGYREVTEEAAFQPSDDEAWSVIFACLLVSRASDELTSRLGSRSDWLGIPLAGLDELLGGSDPGA